MLRAVSAHMAAAEPPGRQRRRQRKFVVAEMSHETNTFSPVITDLARFAGGLPGSGAIPPQGEAVLADHRGARTGLGAFIELADAAGDLCVASIAASAPPSGTVQDAAFEYIVGAILATIEAESPVDGILLCLHGAMAVESYEDGEGELLRRIREQTAAGGCPRVPIAITLDMHCNFFDAIAEHADTVAGYHTYPHEDMYETALRAGRPLFSMMDGAARPTTAWGGAPMMPHVMRQSTLPPYPGRAFRTPNKKIQERCLAMETSGEALIASVFVGFAHADISFCGLSAVVVTDGDPAAAAALRDELLAMAWQARHEFVFEPEPLGQALGRAQAMADERPDDTRPVILLDHYDNCASGGTMDTTAVLKAVLEAGLADVCFYAVFDPVAVAVLHDAGEGGTVRLELGGKLPMPGIGEPVGVPLEVEGLVLACVGGDQQQPAAAVLCVGDKVDICVVSRHIEPSNLSVMTDLGIDPLARRYLVLKSRVHWQNSRGFGPIYKGVVECDGLGVCGSDYAALTFHNVARPVFPLDQAAEFDLVAAQAQAAVTAAGE
eukprot:SAG22_NODE_1718_length_3741_cov_6.422021_2_plen_550_part_00